MRVLILQSQLGTLLGGGETFTRNLFQAFSARGHEVEAAFFADRSGSYPIPLPSGIKPVPIAGWWSRKAGQSVLSAIGRRLPQRFNDHWNALQERISWRTVRWYNLSFQRRVEEKFHDRWSDFDVVYVHGNRTLAARIADIRPTLLRLPGPVAQSSEPLLRKVQVVCANGDALVQIRKFMGDSVIDLPTGLNRDLFKPQPSRVRDQLNWNEADFVLGYVGRFTKLKGVDLLARAFKSLSDRLPDLRLLMIGHGEEEKNLRTELKQELESGRVHFAGGLPHSSLAEWYCAMDLLVMPSRYENFSNAILEGMACGIPFLASDVGGNRIYARSGAGWLFEAKSHDSLLRQIESIAAAGEERLRRGKIALESTREYSWERRALQLETIIQTCLQNGHH